MAMPVVGVVLVLRPELAQAVVVCAVMAIAALRRSRVQYQRILRY
ncbi:hypothetical protein [Streptomyces anulatus]